jgi:SPOR domain
MADRYPYRAERADARDNHNAARSTEGDPLAELARLIGQTDQNAFANRAQAPQSKRANYQQQPQQQYQDPRYQDQRYHDQHTHDAHDQHAHEQGAYDQHAHDQQAEPSDPEPAQPSWMRTAATREWQQPAPAVHHAAPEQPRYPHDDDYSDTPAFLRTARQHDHSRYDDVLYDQNSQNAVHPQYADGQYQDGYPDQSDPNAYPSFYGDGEPEEEQPRRKRGGLMTVLAVVVLAFVGTAAAYGYRSFTGSPRSGEPPVIKAEPGANKIVPPTQTSDATGKIVDRIGGNGNGQERVVSREEQPVDINGRNPPRVVFPQPNLNPAPQVTATTQVPPPAAQAGASNGALGDEPKRVRTYAIRPDQPDAVPQGAAQAQRAPTQARAQAPAPAGNAPVSLSPQSGAAPGRTQTAAVAPAPAPAPSATTGGYMVQITSQRSEADAQASYRAVQLKYPDVLGSHTPSIRRADLGEKGIYYRALIGPFAAAEEAGKLCTSLKSAGGQCVVQRN